MATCQDIDQTLAQIQASHAAQIARLEAKLDGCCAKTDDALAKALQALSEIASIAGDVQQALSSIAQIGQTLQALQGVVAGGAAVVAGLAATVANLVITIGGIAILGSRIDALETGLSQVSADLSGAYGLIQGLRNYTDGRLQELYELFSFQFNSLLTEVYRLNAELRVRIDECCKKIDDFLDPNNPNNPNNPVNQQCCQDIKNSINTLNTKIDNISNVTNNTQNDLQVVNAGLPVLALKLGELAASIASIFGLVTTILNFVDAIKNFLFPKPDPLTEAQTRDILDSYFPNFAGTTTQSGCDGVPITKQYQGKGLIGIERMFGAFSDLQAELIAQLCQNTSQQGFINATVCGKPFTGTFRGANEGIQRLGDLIGFAITETCDKVDNIDIDFSSDWDLEIKPKFEASLNIVLDTYFPTISDRFEVSLCDGNTTSYGYLGKGFGGVQLALQAMHTMQTRQLDSYFACIITTFFPEFQGTLKTTFCDGTDYSESYLERGISGLNNVLKLQNKMNVIWQNRFAECFIRSERFSGQFSTLDCEGNNITEIYNSTTMSETLEIMFRALARKIDDLCGDYNDSILAQDCTGDIIRGEYRGKGYRGLQMGLQIHTGVLIQVIKSICDKLDNDSNTPTSGLVRLEACDQVFQGTYNAPKKSETNAIAQLGFKLVGDAINAICVKTEEDKNVRTSGALSLNSCGITESVPYLVAKDSEVSGFANFMMILLGKAFDRLCEKLDDILDIVEPNNPNEPTKSGQLSINACGSTFNANYTALASQEPQIIANAQLGLIQKIFDIVCQKLEAIDPNNPINNPNISGNLSALVCGKQYSYSYGVPESALTAELVKGNLDILSKVLNDFCDKLEPEQPQNYNIIADICNDPINFNLFVTNGEFQVAQATIAAVGNLALKMCQEFDDLEACDPLIIEPSDKYIDRVITSQATIWFYPVGTTKSQRKASPKWRLQLSNPRPGLTCADFAPLTWQRGYWLSKIVFDMGAIETYSYFGDYDPVTQTGDASEKMLYLASLSTIPLRLDKCRVTRTNFPGVLTPNQPTIEVVRVVFADYDANGQRTAVRCLQCVP